ncbi:type IV pilin protein [Cognatilysobacter segetis]|uniref:type IV pilin protein n=1 Tax=Cognatilysobacter segetis TaxID=2492394 RepID=UPI00106094BB|nr:type IV pilin protein [Lysobacter segetis]
MQTRNSGFTLIEIMIVVVIISILASIAYPAYIKYTIKARRSAGAACLMEQAQFMERYYSTNMGYTGAALPATGCTTELASHYSFGFSAGPAATSYTLAATPRGTQAAKDTECGTMRIDQKGTKTVSGTASATPARCF